VRAVALHPDVIVVTSRVWQTTCTVVRGQAEGGDDPAEAFVVDSPLYPDELELLPVLLEQAGFPFSGLLATHGDWDHLLGRFAFPDAALGCAETTATRLAAEVGAPQRALRDFDDEHYVVRPRPLALGELQPLPVPGRLDVGERELELHPTAGHTPDGMAVWAPWAGVLVAGDYLSPVEIPSLAPAGSAADYAATLQRLRPLVVAAEHVVPGHGEVLDSTRALEVLEADLAYLSALQDAGADAPLPRASRSRVQRERHAENAAMAGRAP
jgi:glyoxylase-like metal-dependent hydrolase (beta-lactamase superfamily II)